VTLLGQVVLLREVIVANQGNELAAVLGLGIWLVGGALGAAIGGGPRFAALRPSGDGYTAVGEGDRHGEGDSATDGESATEDLTAARIKPATALRAWRRLLLGLAVVLPASVVLARLQRDLFGVVPGASVSLVQMVTGLLLVLVPASALGGALLRRAAAGAVRCGLPLVRAYAVESVGGLLGGAAATLLLRFGVANLEQVLATGAVAAWFAAGVGTHPRSLRRRVIRGAAALAGLALAVITLFLAPALEHRLASRDLPGLAGLRDTPYGRVAVTRLGEQVALYADGALVRASGGSGAEEAFGLPMLQATEAQRCAVLGLGGWEEVIEARAWGLSRIEWVVEDEVALELLLDHGPARLRELVTADEVVVRSADPRVWLDEQRDIDIIIVVAAEPNSGRDSRFYTREFFERARGSLSRMGVLALRLPPVANVWTPLRSARDASIWRALGSPFAERMALVGETGLFFLAAPIRLERDPEVLAARLAEAPVTPNLLSPLYLEYLLRGDRFAEARRVLDTTEVRVNTDVRPVCYAYGMALWLSRHLSRWIWRPPTPELGRIGAGIAVAVAILLAALALLFTRRRGRARRALVVGLGGGAGLVLEAVLLLHYQLQHGVLYLDLGLLLMAFMAGIALGGWLAEPLARFAGPRGTRSGAALAFLALGIYGLTRLEIAPGLLVTAGLQLATGAGATLLFALAAMGERGQQEQLAGTLLAADLLGGALASVVTALVLVPWLGIPGTALVGVVLAAVAAVLARWPGSLPAGPD